MAQKKCIVAFSGTEEQENELKAVIAEHSDDSGALMPVLQKAQEIYGYRPAWLPDQHRGTRAPAAPGGEKRRPAPRLYAAGDVI